MSDLEIVRAWKDEEYRLSLSDDQRAMLPPHPAGLIEVGVDLDTRPEFAPTHHCNTSNCPFTRPLSNCCTP